MLNKKKLEEEIRDAFETLLPPAFEQAQKAVYPFESERGNELAKKYGEVFSNIISGPLAKALASAIDTHVRTADVYGTVITTGTAVTQQAKIDSPMPFTNGKIPNTFGIK